MSTSSTSLASEISRRQPTPAHYGFVSTVGRMTFSKLKEFWTIFFIIGIPVLMYLMFGTAQDYVDYPLPHGNVSAQIMINMAQYGAAI